FKHIVRIDQNFVALVTAPGGNIILCAAVGAAFKAETKVTLHLQPPAGYKSHPAMRAGTLLRGKYQPFFRLWFVKV
ncbi:hypothetical protein HZD82_25735, partial [Pantoea agglomerans]|nr:hypothetical protein [Pantoea agglomerans]